MALLTPKNRQSLGSRVKKTTAVAVVHQHRFLLPHTHSFLLPHTHCFLLPHTLLLCLPLLRQQVVGLHLHLPHIFTHNRLLLFSHSLILLQNAVLTVNSAKFVDFALGVNLQVVYNCFFAKTGQFAGLGSVSPIRPQSLVISYNRKVVVGLHIVVLLGGSLFQLSLFGSTTFPQQILNFPIVFGYFRLQLPNLLDLPLVLLLQILHTNLLPNHQLTTHRRLQWPRCHPQTAIAHCSLVGSRAGTRSRWRKRLNQLIIDEHSAGRRPP